MTVTANTAAPITRGLRVFTAGHSFHYWIPDILPELVASAGIAGHSTVGVSLIGGSRAIQHWEVSDDKNAVKKALRESAVDVFTLSCMTHPDEGIGHFARLAARHNPQVRVTLQELWLPEDTFPFDPNNRRYERTEQFDHSTLADLAVPHAAYFAEMEGYVRNLNAELGRAVVYIAPDAQATLKLRGKIIAGQVQSIRRQSALFTDSWGHPQPVLKLLAAYVHFAVIYRRSPVGLPWPKSCACEQATDADLNRDLQQFAWQAVCEHPLSGVGMQG